MRIIKITWPVALLILLILFARQSYGQLPITLQAALPFLPYMMALLTLGLCLYFNQGRILIYALIVITVYILIEQHWMDSNLKLVLVCISGCLIITATGLFADYGIYSIRSIPTYWVFITVVFFTLWLLHHQPPAVIDILLKNIFAEQYFDWTEIPQIAWFFAFIAFFVTSMLLVLRQDNISVSAMLVLLITVLMLQQKNDQPDQIIFSSAALSLCLWTVLQQSWRMAYLDELTQLPGRRALNLKLKSILGVYAIAMIDVDHFKKFNDSYGHETGDDVLRMIAAKLKKINGGGKTYRYGGEEFTTVFGNHGANEVKIHLEEIRKEIAEIAFVVNRNNNKATKRKTVQVTISIGLADSIKHKSAIETLKMADKALYRAKKKGRNRLSR